MISTYLVAVVESKCSDEPFIEPITASSYADAKEKFIDYFVDTYDIEYPSNWEELIDSLSIQHRVYVSPVYSKDEF